MSIAKTFENHEIFITGGTGFIGKALIEKLLYSCGTLSKIYVLLRPKKGQSAEERLQTLLKSKLCNRLRHEKPDIFNKVVAIAGDVQELGLGISKADLARLRNVSIVYHSAASVRFDDALRPAILMNTRGTHELIKLALQWQHLKAFVHVSTTYSNSDKHVVEERIYPPYTDWRESIRLAEAFDEETLEIYNLKYSDFKPNTYTFTKNLAEHVATDYRDQLPIFVFRPSIVISAIEEPTPGWADNFNGPIGMLVACGVGIVRSQCGNPNTVADFVPVDVVVRALLVSTYKYLVKPPIAGQSMDVYNCAAANISPITMGEVIDLGRLTIRKNPFEKTLWLPGGCITPCPVLHFMRFITMHIMMAIVVDTLLRLSNEKPFLLKLQRRIFQAYRALRYFAVTEWEFKNANFRALHDIVPEKEIDVFGYMQHANLHYGTFFKHGIRGAKEYLMNESPDSSRAARLRMKIFLILDYGLRIILYGFLVRFLFKFVTRTYFV